MKYFFFTEYVEIIAMLLLLRFISFLIAPPALKARSLVDVNFCAFPADKKSSGKAQKERRRERAGRKETRR